MRLKSNIYQCRYECPKCINEEVDDTDEIEIGGNEIKEDKKKRQRHCHCPLWKPSAELVESMTGGQPCRRYKSELKKRREELDA